MFLKLTGSTGNVTLINVAHITCVIQDHDAVGFTFIGLSTGAVLNVRDTAAEIFSLIKEEAR